MEYLTSTELKPLEYLPYNAGFAPWDFALFPKEQTESKEVFQEEETS